MIANTGLSGNGPSAAASIERDIELTRQRVSRDIDELGDRLRPSRLTEQAQRALLRNPWPAVAAGVGLLWMMVRKRMSRSRKRPRATLARRAVRAAYVR